jgi:hypothetical protein
VVRIKIQRVKKWKSEKWKGGKVERWKGEKGGKVEHVDKLRSDIEYGSDRIRLQDSTKPTCVYPFISVNSQQQSVVYAVAYSFINVYPFISVNSQQQSSNLGGTRIAPPQPSKLPPLTTESTEISYKHTYTPSLPHTHTPKRPHTHTPTHQPKKRNI